MFEMLCNCGKKHTAPLERYIIKSNILSEIPQILKEYKSVYMVCDVNTYKAAGELVEKILVSENMFSHRHILKSGVLPDCTAVGDVLIHLQPPDAESNIEEYSPKPDLILAVGSGTVNDICRLVSYRVGIPYAIVGTAPSMDGYASAGSPMLFDGTKATIKCTTPRYIIADLEIMRNAPYEMLLAGIGDMFGKYTGILDWELARDYNGEYYCENIAADVIKATDACLGNGYNIKNRDAECIGNIVNGFMATGLGMAYTGNSRPASGSEHIIAHAWELFDIEDGKAPNLHGLEVLEATILVSIIYKRLYNETKDLHLKNLIAKYLPYFENITAFCKDMGVPAVTSEKEKILNGIKRALTLRNRYTVLFYLRDNGLFDDYAEYAANELQRELNGY